jgi:hypothetical protein
MKRLLAFAAVAALSAAGAAGAAQPSPAPVTSCDTFRAWFALQPGSRLTLAGTTTIPPTARPKKPDTILTYGPWGAAETEASWTAGMKQFRGIYGGGGCLGGYYDASARTALVLERYDTASDLTITTIASAPVGLPAHAVPRKTRNGAAVGMTLAQVQAIEGKGALSRSGGYEVLAFDQGKAGPGAEYGWLRFLFKNGAVAAIDVGYGE